MIWQKIGARMVKSLRCQMPGGGGPNITTHFSLAERIAGSRPSLLAPSPQSSLVPRGRMLAQQAGLPKLPVPPLSQTLNRFLDTAKPLYNEEQYNRAKQLVEEFGKPGGEGEQLQKLLEKRYDNTTNWLSEYWLNAAYLDFRIPCPIHVNPGILMLDQDINGVDDQVKYAANWASGVLDYKRMVDDQSLPVEHMGKAPLCMDQYFKILNACRIPGIKRDSFVVYPPDSPDAPKHICVIHNNHIFSVRVYGDDGRVLSRDQLEQQFKKLMERSGYTGPPVGILTADGRNQWGKVYKRLRKDPHNAKLLDEIQRSIFVMCLDKPCDQKDFDQYTIMANQMNHGCGGANNSCNRWFDKTIQFIIGPDGAVGANYEHCSAEGPPILAIIDHAMNYVKARHPSKEDATGVTDPVKLKFNLDSQIDDDFEHALSCMESTIEDLDMIAYQFNGYGKEFPKSQRLSPDALIQVCIQFAYYRIYGYTAPTYESGSLRKFQEGRTETIRSCTIASTEFCKAMLDSSASAQDKVARLKEAVDSHRAYTNWVVNGQGIDRHLLGLKLTAVKNKMNIPEFLMDPLFSESSHWRISTSQVPSSHNALLTFGPVVPDGYGICYNPMPHQVNFCVSAWRSCAETDAQKMMTSLVTSLEETRNLLLQTQSSKL